MASGKAWRIFGGSLFGALDPFDRELAADFVFWPEGEKDVDTLTQHCVPAFTFGGTGDGLPDGCESYAAGRHVVILADNDKAGRKHANAKAERVHKIAASVRIVKFPELPPKTDVSDWIAQGHTAEELTALADAEPQWMPQAESAGRWRAAGHNDPASPPREWPDPVSLPRGLSKVDDFNLAFLPNAIAPWAGDISDRLQCPPDYVGIAAMTALGSVIGRRISIKPQAKTDWFEVPNAWGMFIGRPGMLKSPAMGETHARRVYGSTDTIEIAAATAILARIRKGDLEGEFTARDIHRKDWSGLTDREVIRAGLNLLCDLDHLAEASESAGVQGGRPKIKFFINPKTLP